MANQYTGVRKATKEELLQLQVERLEREMMAMATHADRMIAILTEAYTKEANPYICRVLVISGVDVWSIDKALGRETIYIKSYELRR